MRASKNNNPAGNPEGTRRKWHVHASCVSSSLSRNGRPFEASSVAIAVALLATLSQAAHAANYTVSNETELRNAITAANADPDTSATITLTGNIGLSSTTALPNATKPIALDTASFMLSGYSGGGSGGNLQSAGTWTTSGTLRGGDANGTGMGGQGFNGSGAQLINLGTIRGGTGGTGTGVGALGGIGATFGLAGANQRDFAFCL